MQGEGAVECGIASWCLEGAFGQQPMDRLNNSAMAN